MFTGLIEEIGQISSVTQIAGGKRLKIKAVKILDDLKIDDSVAINGVCLTSVKIDSDGFWTEAVGTTLEKTTLAKIHQGETVNLERAVRLSDRLGGHLVQGHVNGIGTITKISKLGENYFIEVSIPDNLQKYLIDEGSIALDGISLTIAKLINSTVGLSIIPHTWNNTNLVRRKVGDKVNIETDVIAKYIEKLISSKENPNDKFSDEWFKKIGY
jgi:riboflavin synthase